MSSTIQSLIFDPTHGDLRINDIFIPLHTNFPEFKEKLLSAGILFKDQGNSLHLNCYENFINPKKYLKVIPKKKLGDRYQILENNHKIQLVQMQELDLEMHLNFNSSGKLAGLFIEIRDRNEDYSSWETYDIDKCYKTHLDWLNEKIKLSKRMDGTVNLAWLTGYLIRDKSENIYWSLKVRQKNRE